MDFFFQMGQDQPLPVHGQVVQGHRRAELHSAAPLAGGEQQVHFRIVAQGLVMPHALHGGQDGFPVQHAFVGKADLHAEPVLALAL